MRATLYLLAAAAGVTAALACADPSPTQEGAVGPIERLNGTCHYTPTPATILIDSSQTFIHDSDCNTSVKKKMTLTWSGSQTPARVSFGIAGPCVTQQVYAGGNIKVFRCDSGLATLTIYSDSVGTSVLQTITIDETQ